MKKTALVVLAVAFCLVQPVMAQAVGQAQPTPAVPAAQPTVGLKIADALFVRPPSVVGAAASTAAYVLLALPAHIMGFSDALADSLVVAPWHFVNGRELGQFNDLSALPPPSPKP